MSKKKESFTMNNEQMLLKSKAALSMVEAVKGGVPAEELMAGLQILALLQAVSGKNYTWADPMSKSKRMVAFFAKQDHTAIAAEADIDRALAGN